MSDCREAKNETQKVRQLQRSLYRKSKQEKEVRFYSLYDKVYRKDVLWEAWHQVKTNKGAPGIDGKTIEDIIAHGEEEMINKLQKQLQEQSYRFSPLRVVEILKASGRGTRPLGIASIEDRVVQTAMKLVIEPIFEAGFHDCSYGYRPKRSAKQASLAIRKDLYQRAWGVVEIDFKAYFTSIPHDKLIEQMSSKIADGSMLKLIKQTLKVGNVKDGNIITPAIGVSQGSPISPLYSNIYLNTIDQEWHKMGYPEKLGSTLYRFCDDVILICRKGATPVLKKFTEMAVKSVTSRKAPIQPKEFIGGIRLIVLGWVNYFRHTNANKAFQRLQHFMNIRFRRYLTHRRKGRGFEWQRYPNKKLYGMGMIYIGSGCIKY